MMLKKGVVILHVWNGVFIRYGVVLNMDSGCRVKWLKHAEHIKHTDTEKIYTDSFINSKIFDLIDKSTIDNVIEKYVKMEDYATLVLIRDEIANVLCM